MRIGGFQKLTLVDYPGKIACTVFLSGCNFRCPFCYSGELVLPEKIKEQPQITEDYFFDFLETRKGLLDGVVICGGEPTIHKDLSLFLRKIKKFGYLIKLDTNGSNPEMIEKLIDKKLVDYIAMDIKAPKEKYDLVAGVKTNIKKIQKSIDILKKGKVDYEFRTTVVPGILKKEDILKIVDWISFAKKYYLQNFLPEKETIDPSFMKTKPFPDNYLLEIKKAILPFFEICDIR